MKSIFELLDNGITEHAPVLDPNKKEKLKYLNKLADNAHGTIIFFEADLLTQVSYDEAFERLRIGFPCSLAILHKG